MIELAKKNAQAIGAGHTFIVFLGEGYFPVNVLNAIKQVPEVCRVFCATANPLQAIVARTTQGGGILGVIDGESPKGVARTTSETERDSPAGMSPSTATLAPGGIVVVNADDEHVVADGQEARNHLRRDRSSRTSLFAETSIQEKPMKTKSLKNFFSLVPILNCDVWIARR